MVDQNWAARSGSLVPQWSLRSTSPAKEATAQIAVEWDNPVPSQCFDSSAPELYDTPRATAYATCSSSTRQELQARIETDRLVRSELIRLREGSEGCSRAAAEAKAELAEATAELAELEDKIERDEQSAITTRLSSNRNGRHGSVSNAASVPGTAVPKIVAETDLSGRVGLVEAEIANMRVDLELDVHTLLARLAQSLINDTDGDHYLNMLSEELEAQQK